MVNPSEWNFHFQTRYSFWECMLRQSEHANTWKLLFCVTMICNPELYEYFQLNSIGNFTKKSYYLYQIKRYPYILMFLQIHNETGNIWTHFLAALIHTYATYSYFLELDWRDQTTWGILVYGVSITVYSLLSSLAHLFQSKSELIHYVLFSLDYTGIGIYGYGKRLIRGISLNEREGSSNRYNYYKDETWFLVKVIRLYSERGRSP